MEMPPISAFSGLTPHFLTQEKNKTNKNNDLRVLFHNYIGKKV
tara:strand:- start:177357 stop:177485 length:129 start_codon:yes stop_codon:yes gene_type:complete